MTILFLGDLSPILLKGKNRRFRRFFAFCLYKRQLWIVVLGKVFFVEVQTL